MPARISQDAIESLLYALRNVRLTQGGIELVLYSLRNVRSTQDAIEVLISDVAIPSKTRVSQGIIEVVVLTAVPVVTRRYGPRLQSV